MIKEIISWFLCIPITLYCLNASHFLLWAYKPYSQWEIFLKPSLFFVAICSMALVFFEKKVSLKIAKDQSWQYYVIFILGVVLIDILKNEKIVPNKTALLFYAICLPLLLSENNYRKIFTLIILGIGSLAFLNIITAFHWLGFCDLPNIPVERFAGADDLYAQLFLQPISFGFFGLTEFKVEDTALIPTARLMGWSPEPIHWGYLVMTAASYAVLIFNFKASKVISFLAIYLTFLGSTAAILVFLYFLICVVLIHQLKKIKQVLPLKINSLAFLLVVLIPGILAPSIIAFSREVKEKIYEDSVTNEHNNWENKLEFKLFPKVSGLLIGDSSPEAQSHNFIHQCLLFFGLPCWLAFLCFLNSFFINSNPKNNYIISAIFILLINLYQCPSLLLPQSAISLAGLLKIKK